jgi:hypothetical protein
MVKSCDKCQRFAWIMTNPLENLSPITLLWPFAKWRVDIVGLMPPRKGNRRFLVVAVDYFTKWVEAEALAAITTENITKFLWRSVVCRFGIPYAFVTDSGKQFDCVLENGALNFTSAITTLPQYFLSQTVRWKLRIRRW